MCKPLTPVETHETSAAAAGAMNRISSSVQDFVALWRPPHHTQYLTLMHMSGHVELVSEVINSRVPAHVSWVSIAGHQQ